MRRALLTVVSSAASLLVLAPPAHADLLSDLTKLAMARQTPASLIPVRLPKVMTPVDDVSYTISSGSNNDYSIALERRKGRKTIGLMRFDRSRRLRSLGALRRERSRFDRIRKTRVRGKHALALTGRFSPTRNLAWIEEGLLYELGTGTSRAISMKELRATAGELDPLERDYNGSFYGSDGAHLNVVAVTTRRTVTLHVNVGAPCFKTSGERTLTLGASGTGFLVPRQGATFSTSLPIISGSPLPTTPWTNQISGTVSPESMQLTAQAFATFGASDYTSAGDRCDTGRLSANLADRAT